ncbi:MAG: 50S ribosomal protein L4 [Candidatus Shikimatogenerans sp. Tcar]|uniref:Large ribosomal subunit protein uL4 n=1 Tax=Candidatus Shikimatogenerans sp. Tcar TaxID=3158565 RepID=A0AAU7QRQ2_9FLAO
MYIKVYNLYKLKFIKKIKIINYIKKYNKYLIYYYFKKYFTNKRFSIASTKNKSQIKGSNRKICKQKGLGIARKGNIKNPLFKGGGVIFGPKNKKYNIKINKKIINISYKIILNEKIKKNNIIIIKNFFIKKINLQYILKFLNKFFYLNEKFLFIINNNNYNLFIYLNNIKNIKVILLNNINIFLLKKYKYIILDNFSLLKKIYN